MNDEDALVELLEKWVLLAYSTSCPQTYDVRHNLLHLNPERIFLVLKATIQLIK